MIVKTFTAHLSNASLQYKVVGRPEAPDFWGVCR